MPDRAVVVGLLMTSLRMPTARDVALAVPLLVIELAVVLPELNLVSNAPAGSDPLVTRLTVLTLSVVAYLALLWRRQAPTTVFALVLGHGLLASQVLGLHLPNLGLYVALFTVARQCRLGISLLALAAATAEAIVTVAADDSSPIDVEGVAGWIGWILLLGGVNAVVWYAGRRTRTHGERLRRLEREKLERETQARLAVAEERARLARELHDIVAHSVSVMMLQAAGARSVLSQNPGRAEVALRRIVEAGQQSTGELRRMLNVLRAPGEGTAREAQVLQPVAQLSDLDALVRRVQAAGVSAQVHVDGEPAVLDRSVDLTAYRIVQEALTNTMKHAGPDTHVWVQLTWSDDQLHVEVADDGSGSATSSPTAISTGSGLAGLRERVRAVGGHLEAGPRPDRGFRITAVLPTSHHAEGAAPQGRQEATTASPAPEDQHEHGSSRVARPVSARRHR